MKNNHIYYLRQRGLALPKNVRTRGDVLRICEWSPCYCHGLLVAVMVSSLPPWSPHCCHGLLVAAMVSSLVSWSPRCRHGLLVAAMVSSLPPWSPHCRHGLLVANMVSSLPPWSPCCCHGLLIADMVSLLLSWSPHCHHGLLIAAMVSLHLSRVSLLPLGHPHYNQGLPAVELSSTLPQYPLRPPTEGVHTPDCPLLPSGMSGQSTSAYSSYTTSPAHFCLLEHFLIDRCVLLRATGSHHHT